MSRADGFQLLPCRHPLVEETYQKRSIPLADGTTAPMDVYVPREEGDYLYSLVRHHRPSLTVEVGMANGLSTVFIAQALKENGQGRHVAIDPFQFSDWKGAGVTLLRQAGLDGLVELIEKPSHQALPELEARGAVAQFVFVDGSHLFDYVIADFLCCDRLLEVGGLLAFDDSDWPAISRALRYVVTNRHYQVAYPEIVIEDARFTPTLSGKVLRRLGKAVPKLGEKIRPDFLVSNHEMGIQGRCVVLKKLGPDDRDSQSRFHQEF
jgi:predicted O-methyltransferase YrrM